METHPHIPPSLPALLSLIAGIVTGRMAGASSVAATPLAEWLLWPSVLGVAAVVLAVTALLPKIDGRIATLLTLTAVLTLGIFLTFVSPAAGWEKASQSMLPPSLADYMAGRRVRLAEIYAAAGLSGDEFSLVTAMTLGDRQHVSDALREAYAITGASHIFALSGLHLGIIYIFLSFSLPRRRFPRASVAVLLSVLWAYAMLVCLRPSIVRSAVMLSTYTLLGCIGRRTDGLSALLAAAFLLLLIRPWWLFDAGFQMSFMAVLGIMLFRPSLVRLAALRPQRGSLYRPTPGEPSPLFGNGMTVSHLRNALILSAGWLWSVIALSLSAQIGVVPLIAYYFGQFSPYPLLSSLLVIPLASAIIPLSFALLILGLSVPLLPFLAPVMSLCATLLTLLLRLMNGGVEWISTLPGA